MQRYTDYKEAHAVWIDALPAHWDCKKLGSLFSERREKVSDKDYPPLSVAKAGVVPQLETAVKTDAGDNRKRVCAGDFVINSRSDRKGSCGVSRLEGSVSLINIVLIPTNDWNERYVHYLLRSQPFSEEYYRNGRGIVADLWTTRYSEMKSIVLPVPPLEEQDQIVRFLDWKVSKINSLIEIKKKQIAVLQRIKDVRIREIVKKGLNDNCNFKDSGIDYIGCIPEHWKVFLNGRLFKEKSRKFEGDELVLSLSQKDGLLPYKDMTERSLHTASYDNWKLVFPNDLVLNRFKAHLGVFFSSMYQGIVTFHYGVFEPKMDANSKYYEALYHTSEYRTVYAGRSNGMTVGLQNLSNQNFYSVYTIYPPIEEQNAIVDKIDTLERKTKDAVAKINDYVEKLHELRARIIADTVTGQIDVRDVMIPDYEYMEEDDDTVPEDGDDFNAEDQEE